MSGATITVHEYGQVWGPGVTYSGASVASIVRREYGRRATISPRTGSRCVGVVVLPSRDYPQGVIAHRIVAATGPYALEDRPLEVRDADRNVLGTVRRTSVQRVRTTPHGGASTSAQAWQAHTVTGAPIGPPLRLRRHAVAALQIGLHAAPSTY